MHHVGGRSRIPGKRTEPSDRTALSHMRQPTIEGRQHRVAPNGADELLARLEPLRGRARRRRAQRVLEQRDPRLALTPRKSRQVVFELVGPCLAGNEKNARASPTVREPGSSRRNA